MNSRHCAAGPIATILLAGILLPAAEAADLPNLLFVIADERDFTERPESDRRRFSLLAEAHTGRRRLMLLVSTPPPPAEP